MTLEEAMEEVKTYSIEDTDEILELLDQVIQEDKEGVTIEKFDNLLEAAFS